MTVKHYCLPVPGMGINKIRDRRYNMKKEHTPNSGTRSWFLIRLMYITIVMYTILNMAMACFDKYLPDQFHIGFFGVFVIQFINLASIKKKRLKKGECEDESNNQ